MSSNADRNLLFGVLALQFGFISREALVAATTAWINDKSKSFEELLSGELKPEETKNLLSLLDMHLSRHGNDVQKSLESLKSVYDAQTELEDVQDEDITRSVGNIALQTTVPVGDSSFEGRRYENLSFFRRGGLGEIWKARDTELNRQVAVKKIRPDRADDVMNRIRMTMEAEITGGLEHPNIVPVHGFDSDPDGRPLYAMRFLYGNDLREELADFHEKHSDPFSTSEGLVELRRLMSRLIEVCHAIAYAHGRGVLHRDLKPGNIMLGEHGETYVADWGLSSAGGNVKEWSQSGTRQPSRQAPLKPKSSDQISENTFGSVLGTPGYASPEQTRGDLENLEPASDVYALGVILYEIVTGEHPFYENDTSKDTRERITRKVCDGNFQPPRAVKQQVPKPLDAICKKAMALDVNERYHTPLSLAEDLERWMADEPVTAWSEPISVRTRRWVKKHRTLVSTIAASFAVAMVGLIVGFIALSAAYAETDRQRNIAETNFSLARSTVDELFISVSETTLLERPALKQLRRDLLNKAKDYYLRFVAEKPDGAGLERELARAYFSIGLVEEELGNSDVALGWYAQAMQLQDEFVKRTLQKDPNLLHQIQFDLGMTLNAVGRVKHNQHELDEALDLYGKAREIRKKLAETTPNNLEYQRVAANSEMNVGLIHKDRGETDEAWDRQSKAQTQREEALKSASEAPEQIKTDLQRDMGKGNYNLAVLELLREKPEEAVKRLETARDQFQQLVDDNFNIDEDHYYLVRCHKLLGQIVGNSRDEADLRKSIEHYKQAYQLAQELNRLSADVPKYEHLFSQVCIDTGLGFSSQDPETSRFFYDEAIFFLRKCVNTEANNFDMRSDLATALLGLGILQLHNDEADDGAANVQESLELLLELKNKASDAAVIDAKIERAQSILKKMNDGDASNNSDSN